MPNNPIKKAAGQTVEEMTSQLAGSREGNRLYTPKQGTYKEISDALKAEALDSIIDQQLELLATAKRRGRVNLNNVDEGEATATAYMTSCKQAGVYPTMLGFAAACGYSRKSIYEFISKNRGKSVDYLDGLRSSWAAIIAQMGLARQCSESVSIFLLKNSGQGMADKAEIDIAPKVENPLGERTDPEELRRKYLEDVRGSGATIFDEDRE
ncbi:MAG: hypothetical protein EGQ46_01135 [Clostridiales bacterium]|nr:hypothetical protein [Clostridiales bacterium]